MSAPDYWNAGRSTDPIAWRCYGCRSECVGIIRVQFERVGTVGLPVRIRLGRSTLDHERAFVCETIGSVSCGNGEAVVHEHSLWAILLRFGGRPKGQEEHRHCGSSTHSVHRHSPFENILSEPTENQIVESHQDGSHPPFGRYLLSTQKMPTACRGESRMADSLYQHRAAKLPSCRSPERYSSQRLTFRSLCCQRGVRF